MSVKKRIIQILNLWRLLPAYLCVFSTPVAVKEIILEDIWHWGKCAKRVEKKQFDLFSGLMLELKEFRNLLFLDWAISGKLEDRFFGAKNG